MIVQVINIHMYSGTVHTLAGTSQQKNKKILGGLSKTQTDKEIHTHITKTPTKSKKIQNLELEPWIKGSKVPAHLALEPCGFTDPKIWKSKYFRPELHFSP